MLASQFKNACWTGRVAGVTLSRMIVQDTLSVEISRVNLAYSLLYFCHKKLLVCQRAEGVTPALSYQRVLLTSQNILYISAPMFFFPSLMTTQVFA